MRRLITALTALSLAQGAAAQSFGWPADDIAAERSRTPAPPIDRDRFVTEMRVESAVLAPGGGSIAWLERRRETKRLWLRDSASGKRQVMLARTDATSIAYARNGRWLFLVEPKAIKAVSIAGERGGGILSELPADGRLRFAGVDPWHAAAVILREELRRDGEAMPYRYRLWRAAPGHKRVAIAYSSHPIVDFAIGPDGKLAFVKLAVGDHHELRARRDDGRFRPILRCADLHRCALYGTDASGRRAIFGTDLGGRMALETIDRAGRRALIAGGSDARADLDEVMLDPLSGAPLAVRFTWDRGFRPLNGTRLPKRAVHANEVQADGAGGYLVREGGDRLQGARWWLDEAQLLDDGGTRGRLDPAALAQGFPISLPMSDGMLVHGLLTLPPGKDYRRAPIVAMVHGGPWSHDEIGYGSTAQMFANRGFVVIQPQFRGSTGFGRAYLRAAAGDFGDGRVQRDIEEMVEALDRRGIGSRDNRFIVGASFGGYSVLQALSRRGGPFRAGIATVPPSDLGWTMDWAAGRGDIGTDQGVPFEVLLRALGLDPDAPAVRARLTRESPLRRAESMDKPLLLVAAGRDERVPIRSVTAYAAQLQQANKPARIIVARKAGHRTEDPAARRALLYLADQFLAEQAGNRAAARPSAEVETWLKRNTRG